MHNAILFFNCTCLEGYVKKHALFGNFKQYKQKESILDQTSMHMKEGTRSKQLPEVRRGRKSGVAVERAGELQSSRQV